MQEKLQWTKSKLAQHIASVLSAVCSAQLVLRMIDLSMLQLHRAYRDVADSVIDSESSSQGADV